jgi:uncharacterized protein YigA (DUF484 family)
MSTQRKADPEDETVDASAVAGYLRAHPDFFAEHSSLLASMRIPHDCGAAVSLVEHQINVLRDQNRQLKRKLMDLVHLARDNDRLIARMHHLTLELIRTDSLEQLIDTLHSHMRDEFQADIVCIRLAGLDEQAARETGAEPLDPHAPELAAFEYFFRDNRPVCGRLKQQQLTYLFGERAALVESSSLIPLGSQGSVGMLAIGSSEANRFHPGMGTLYLCRLGELLGQLVSSRIVAGMRTVD